MTSYHALNLELEQTLRYKIKAIHYEKGIRIETLWWNEQQLCLALPMKPNQSSKKSNSEPTN